MKPWKGIVIHCSDSEFGDALMIDRWHKKRGWSAIGYQFVITNGKAGSKLPYLRAIDGQIQTGRPIDKTGAHAEDYNSDYIGICLIGVKDFTTYQMAALQLLIKDLMQTFDIEPENIIGHYQCTTANSKTCPNFDVDAFKNRIFE
ncbi:MAG: N-acetylmuramoyl-L-alanine amidase [Hydrogenovibrio crunogenus]|nr:N-acetylmuramoyl-L-alanine amidase [Hydrogenovibrio crunogenus]